MPRRGGRDVVKIPDGAEYRAAWGKLDSSRRRRIVRAVNRGEPLDDRRDAALAVATARRQQRFWKKAWLLGPVAALLTIGEGLPVYLANALLSTAIIGLMGFFWFRRAGRAAAANLAAAEGRRRKPKEATGGGPSVRPAGGGARGKRGRRGHLPGR